MSAWPGKFVIGLTGNIATGKSVVRKMLEHLGAYGIDADALGHRAIAQGAPGYQPIVDTFGRWILAPDGQIDRTKLGKVVFQDKEAMGQLEAITHPLVRQAMDALIRRATQPVIVIEAIKLLESPTRQMCDAIWVTYAPVEMQIARLLEKRSLTREAALERLQAQGPQEAKLSDADVIIRNDGTFEMTWRQVAAFWEEKFHTADTAPVQLTPAHPAVRGELLVERARPRQASDIASLITRLSAGQRQMNADDVMAKFGEKAYLLLKADGKPVGLAGWQVENLVARTDDVFLEGGIALSDAMRPLVEVIEQASRDLQCEASLLFLPPQMARHEDVWRSLGYETRTVQNLGVRAWQEAAQDSMPQGTVMLFKQLRKDRVLRPV